MTSNIKLTDEKFPSDPDVIEYKFSCLRARQPVGDIFIAVISFKRLIEISYFDVRRVIQDNRDFERYLGIQRPLDHRRVESLQKYVTYADASFPTSIIIALDQDYTRYDQDRNEIILSNRRAGDDIPSTAIRHSARVIDGQHRIAGLATFGGDDFDLSVTIFVGADIADQAQIFSTVNLQQTKVNKSLVYDLYELSKTRSPQKTCHNITVALDRDRNSPFFGRIKRLGFGTEGRVFEPITQATFVEGILKYITKAPEEDRDILLRGARPPKLTGDEIYELPFRNLFIDQKDLEITQIIFNYFTAVATRWPAAWTTKQQGFVLNRTTGVRALLRFLRQAYLRVAKPGEIPTVEQFILRVFKPLEIVDGAFVIENFPPGTGGESKLLNLLRGREEVHGMITKTVQTNKVEWNSN